MWHRIFDSPDTITFHNEMAPFQLAGRALLLGRHKGAFYAFNAQCPHASAPFRQGYIDARGNVVCPLHHYKFCIMNGKNISGEGYKLKHYPVEVREDGVYVWMDPGVFGLLP
ncbi:MAG TPA: Rieske (2Fe-2S) protein [Chitinophagaceae bacterium]|nr:Rieske (2Fe-2S) protein [Chitinophagaceae bacterium]